MENGIETQVEKKKPGPTAKPKAEYKHIEEMQERIDKLECMLSKLCALCGNRNLAVDYGLKPWDPDKQDMSKYN